MIGVIASAADRPAAAEFFELFKTAWQWYDPRRAYEAVLTTTGEIPPLGSSALTIIYQSAPLVTESVDEIRPAVAQAEGRLLETATGGFPLYGAGASFPGDRDGEVLVTESGSGAVYGYRAARDGHIQVRLGYDLFAEIRALLTMGQPISRTQYPTLDCHIRLLRQILIDAGIPFCEIPAVPSGYRFAAALTHDVDHPSLRRHGLDHTAVGFLSRALVGSISGWFGGRRSLGEVARNWRAALELPLVLLGIRSDPWRRFVEYGRWEGQDGRSTFFVIPFAERPGHRGDGESAPPYRASAYGAADIQLELSQLRSQGHEIGLHGLDAWRDGAAAREEIDEIRRRSGNPETMGVRMHWLYRGPETFSILEQAGVNYDSTVGYNETVGYRAGTSQVFRPLDGVVSLLELPLVVMDTALFYPSHLNLKVDQAWAKVSQLIQEAEADGGVLTINWHDRSLFPERLWGDFYQQLVKELESRGAWLATAGDCVAWFRYRRGVTFDEHTGQPSLPERSVANLPDLQIDRHNLPVAGASPMGVSSVAFS